MLDLINSFFSSGMLNIVLTTMPACPPWVVKTHHCVLLNRLTTIGSIYEIRAKNIVDAIPSNPLSTCYSLLPSFKCELKAYHHAAKHRQLSHIPYRNPSLGVYYNTSPCHT
jgi:hypothetical protein